MLLLREGNKKRLPIKKTKQKEAKTKNPHPVCSAGWAFCSKATKDAVRARTKAPKEAKKNKPKPPKVPTVPTGQDLAPQPGNPSGGTQIDLATAKIIFTYFRLPDPQVEFPSCCPPIVHAQIDAAQREAAYYAKNPKLNTIMYVIVGQTDGDFGSYQFFKQHILVQVANAQAARKNQIFENGRWGWKTPAERRAQN